MNFGPSRKANEFAPRAPDITPDEDGLAHGKLCRKQERARDMLARRKEPDHGAVSAATGLPMREVRRLAMEVREAKRGAG
jgi:hypothetical protein